MLAGFPIDEFVAHDQIQDFIDGHGFRTTLLCRGDIKLQRLLTPDCVGRHFISGSCQPVDPAMDPNAADRVEFKTETGDMLETDHPLTNSRLHAISGAAGRPRSPSRTWSPARWRRSIRRTVSTAQARSNRSTE